MTTALWIVGVLIGVFILGWMNVLRATFVRNRRLAKMIRPAITAVEMGNSNADELVRSCAEDPATRNHLFASLKEMGKSDVFPPEFRKIEKIAESDMVRWLMHPNELQIAPKEIELLRQVEVNKDEKHGRFFLFRFRVDPPHWAAERGWMSGISGPFWDGDPEPNAGSTTFSELTPYEAMTDSEHVQFLQAAAKKWGFVVPTSWTSKD